MMPDLGKYAAEVLSAYAVTIALMVGLLVISLRQSAKTKAALRAVEEARQARKAGGQETNG